MKRLVLSLLSVALVTASLAVSVQPTQAASTKTTWSRLAGQTRYETAIEVAREFIAARETTGTRPITVILTSGEDRHFGYPLVAPALSRWRNAPLLLTEPRELPNSVQEFLDSSSIEQVVILGDSHIVSTGVEEALSGAGYDVARIAGEDAYATAVAVAERVGSPAQGRPGAYRSHGRTVLVATGEVFADALAAGPLAYRGQHPLLLTPSTRLHAEAARFLRDSGTKHVIILGGSAAVSTSVERSIADLGITVDRWSGRDRYGTAVRVAEELLGAESPGACFDGADAGLAVGDRAADALVSGPLLGEWCAPLLLVEHDALPGVVGQFLKADEFTAGGERDQLHLTAFGGRAAVSSLAVLLAVGAGTLEHIAAQVNGVQGRCYFDVTFAEQVRTRDAQDIENYARAGTALNVFQGTVDAGDRASTTMARIILRGSREHPTSVEPVGCDRPLAAGEQIDVASDSILGESGRHSVRRAVGFVEPDSVRPRLTMTISDAASEAVVTSDEPIRQRTGVAKVRREMPRRLDATVDFEFAEGSTRFTIPAPRSFDGGFLVGDRIILDWGALEDLAGNPNAPVTSWATGDNTPPKVIRASAASQRGRAPASLSVDGNANGSTLVDALTIATLRYGPLYGAIGNEWTAEIQHRPEWPETRRAEPTIVEGEVGGHLTVEVGPGRTLQNIERDLNTHREFRRAFEVELAAGVDDTATLAGPTTAMSLQGGISTVDLRVSWSEPVADCDAETNALDLSRLVIDIDANNQGDVALNGNGAGRFGLRFVEAPDSNAAVIAGSANCDGADGVPSGTLVARLESSNHSALPSLQSRLLVRAGAAVDLNGNRTPEHVVEEFSRS